MMKPNLHKYTILILSALFSIFNAFAQPDPVLWLRAEDRGINEYIWEDVSGNDLHGESTTPFFLGEYLNYNPTLDFSTSQEALKVAYNSTGKDYLKIYVVFKNAEEIEDEEFVYSFGTESQHKLQLSTEKVYDTPEEYLYSGGTVSHALLSVVNKYQGNTSLEETELYIGKGEVDSTLTGAFSGEIAEILVFDTELSSEEQMAVSSYLSIKYGVEILGEDYYNSDGDIIRSTDENEEYVFRVFALARDSGYELHQKQATSATDDILAVSAWLFFEDNESNPVTLAQDSYMFFADNGVESGEWVSKENPDGGSYLLSGRRWKVNSTGGTIYKTPLSLSYKENELFEGIPGDLSLVIDINKDGEFTDIETVQPDSITETHAYFSELNFCYNSERTSYFTFSKSSSLELTTSFTSPVCSGTYGQLDFEIIGGQAPYTYSLIGENNDTVQTQISSQTSNSIASIPEGQYSLDVVDNLGYRYTLKTESELEAQTLFIPLNAVYAFTEERVLELNVCDASDMQNVSFEWSKDSVILSESCTLKATEVGLYKLTVSTEQGCEINKLFYVFDYTEEEDQTSISEATNEYSIQVLPNPTPDKYEIHFEFEKSKDITVYLTDYKGQIIEKEEHKNITNYIMENEGLSPGVYFVSVISENRILLTQELIVM